MEQGFQIDRTDEGVFLQVAPDSEASLSDVVAKIKELGIEEYNGPAVTQAVDEKLNIPVRIAKPHDNVSRESDFRMNISEDGLTCQMWLIPPVGEAAFPTVEQVKGYMVSRGVVYGHDEDAIRNMLETPITKQWVVTAKGDAPINGHDAKIDYKVDLNVLKPKVVGDKVNLKELGSVINVVQGQELAQKEPIFQGKDGTSIMGKKIASYIGKDKNLPAGKGTTLSEDKLHLYADEDGNLYIRDGKLNVNPVFEVKGDVDYSVGNIDFIGPVEVMGSIREGFEVKAGSDLTVDGVVEGANLVSNGNMTIKIGIRGAGKAKVSAKGDIATGYIDQSHVRSEGNILVAEAILHSDVAAAGEIIALGSKKGQIVGGTIRAGRELVCEVLGSEMGTKTEVVVGELPELAEERKRNQENIKQFEEQLEKINANYNFLKKQQAEGQLSEEKQALMAKVTKAKFQLQAQHDSTKKRLDVLEAEYEQNRQEGRVRVKKICYPGVAITIRGVRYLVREEYKFASFIYDDGEVKLSSFDG